MNAWKQLRAILLLPGMVTVVIPATILYCTGVAWPPSPWNIVLPVIGSVLILVGLILMVWTIGLFTVIGKGTLAPGIRRRSSSCVVFTLLTRQLSCKPLRSPAPPQLGIPAVTISAAGNETTWK